MSLHVCIAPTNTLGYVEGGGHLWAYLNWALGLLSLGCEVTWLESVDPDARPDDVQAAVAALRARLEPYGLGDHLALGTTTGEPLPRDLSAGCAGLDAAATADLLLDFRYAMPAATVRRFRRSAMIDIDPGLLQVWIARGDLCVADHDVYFTIGESVPRADDIVWRHTPPCVALDWWPVRAAAADAPFTTVSQWWGPWVKNGDEAFCNDKRTAFQPFLDLPSRTTQRLELALFLGPTDEDERQALERRGWRVRDTNAVAPTPWEYQRYVEASRGEWSCAKPAYVRWGTGWVSDRTLCYLAAGKPAVVQYTGPNRCLPDAGGVWRFRDLDGAARALEAVAADYGAECRAARELAEACFDARRVVARVLGDALA